MSIRLNLFDPEFRQNPYPLYARLRAEAPVCRVDPGDAWAVSRYDDVMFVLRNPQIFSSQGLRALTSPPWLDYNPLTDSLVLLDPPQHTKLRSLVSRAFGGRALGVLEQNLRAFMTDLIAKLPSDRDVDYIKEVALPLPIFVMSQMLGLDPALRHRLKAWVDDLANIDLVPKPEADMARIRTTVSELDHYLRQVIADRKAHPGADMVSDLLGSTVDGQSLTEQEVIGFLFALVVAGLEASVNLLSLVTIALADRPVEMQRIRENTALIPSFIEEVMRYEAPVQATARLTQSEVQLSGTTIPAGALVFALLASANRDESQFPDADRFDVDRNRQGIASFGQGAHFCLGAVLARIEARITVEALLSRFRRITKMQDDVPRNSSIWLRTPTSLLVRLEP